MQKFKDKIKQVFMFEGVMNGWEGTGNLPDPTGSSGGHPIAAVLEKFLNWLLGIFGFLAIIAFIIAGVLYLTAQGDESQIQRAKKMVVYGVVGIVIGLAGVIIVRTIDTLLRG